MLHLSPVAPGLQYISRRKYPMANHRKPPKPKSWQCLRGTCRFCGEDIIEDGRVNKRKHWHQACADTWRIMNNPADARKFVLDRDAHTCQNCGHQDHNGWFEVDHVRPLFEANGDATCWMPENLVLLCGTCHQKKTKIDMERFRNR